MAAQVTKNKRFNLKTATSLDSLCNPPQTGMKGESGIEREENAIACSKKAKNNVFCYNEQAGLHKNHNLCVFAG